MAADKQNNKQQKQQKKVSQSQSSLARLSKIPIVEFTIYLSLNVYNRVKSFNDLSNKTLNGVESLGLSVVRNLQPVMNKFENQIKYVDSLGNTVLDKLEQTVPSVAKFNPKVHVANVSNKLTSWRNYSVEKVNVVRQFDLNARAKDSIKILHNFLDEYYPGNESEETKQDPNTITGSIMLVFTKIKTRSLSKLHNVQRLMF